MSFYKKEYFLQYLAGLVFVILIQACGGNQPAEKPQKDSIGPTGDEDSVKHYYQVQSPADFFASLRHQKISSPTKVMLSPPDINKQYTNPKNRGIDFGIYASDVCFLGHFPSKSNATDHMLSIKSLSDDLMDSSLISKETIQKITKNPSDWSLPLNVVSDMFIQMNHILEKNDKHPLISYIETGAIVENLYISSRLLSNEKEDSDILQYIADQKFVLENLMEMMKDHKRDQGIPELIISLDPLVNYFNSLQEEKVEKVNSSGDKKMVIGAESRFKMTRAKLDELKTITERIKIEIIGTN